MKNIYEHLAKYFLLWDFFKTTMFSWWISWFFRIVNVYRCLFTFNILFDEGSRGLRHEKKHFDIDTIYIAFS